ncbi:MAG TPA: family 78 glycoside hydrolase catalytic domain [Bryocella sp.]|nr:family 78 glycoside hydrolase catalytic domain [Bryocella sp.]
MKRVHLWSTSVVLVLSVVLAAGAAPVKLVQQDPVSVVKLPDGTYLLDFGRVAFGNLLIQPQPGQTGELTVRFGEAMRDGRIDRNPPGSVRYSEVAVSLNGTSKVVAPPADARNTKPPAVLTPREWGTLTPFRWVEIAGWPGELRIGQVRRRAAFDSTWDDRAASFHSSNPMLDRVWNLCHYSIKATTFAGVFVDGDRERLSYEADAYVTQLGYYAGDPNPQMARDTFTRLMQYPTWPTEWAPHMVFVAYADWMQTGDKEWLARHYEWLKTKTLADRVGIDGLVHSNAAQIHRNDIVDWPAGERDGYVFRPVNTVVNAFHLRAMEEMRQLALALGKEKDAEEYAQSERASLAAFQQQLFDEKTGLYRDGVGTDHTSLHANLFPLAFGLVPEDKRAHVAEWLASRGMRASVYAAQYLLEALFENNQSAAALEEITAPGDRSWRHMVDSGTTITWEAWDQRYKPNQDWNHAWGAAPANLLPRFVLGVQVSKPGWTEAEIAPHPGELQFANGTVPTPRGPIKLDWKRSPRFTLSAELPAGLSAQVRLPAVDGSKGVWKNGQKTRAHREGSWWVLDRKVSGRVSLEER